MNPAFDQPFLPHVLREAEDPAPAPKIELTREQYQDLLGYSMDLEMKLARQEKQIAMLEGRNRYLESANKGYQEENARLKAAMPQSCVNSSLIEKWIHRPEPDEPKHFTLMLHPDVFDELQAQNALPDYAKRVGEVAPWQAQSGCAGTPSPAAPHSNVIGAGCQELCFLRYQDEVALCQARVPNRHE